ncbi:hypothetical protein [Delftia tsuruhatensis]|jgi:hypothetical protein|uniref:hypothetical protein n=1 Tax=Delftia tsuruhatensis TaxID=180282 RepID=UPI002091D6E0|nr:hypothetical protein [Delftia tsuruhatensis]MCO5338620.1 hypothetical protein [Delftia tsuruhatensis]MCR4546596.1 hypothetical protein [Delftia tsuruhatensis]
MVTDVVDEQQPEINLTEATGNISLAVVEFTSGLMARLTASQSPSGNGNSKDIAEFYRASLKLSQKLQDLEAAASALSPNARRLWITQNHGLFTRAIVLIEELHKSYFDAERALISSSREVRREKQAGFEIFTKMYASTEEVKQHILEFLENMNPSEVGDMHLALFSEHGGGTQEIVDAFSEISKSGNHTIDAFKQRHNIR